MQISNELAEQIKDCAVQLEVIFDIKIKIGKKKQRKSWISLFTNSDDEFGVSEYDFNVIQSSYESFLVEGECDDETDLGSKSNELTDFVLNFIRWLKSGIIVHYQWTKVPHNNNQYWQWKPNGDGRYIIEFYERATRKDSICCYAKALNEPYRSHLLEIENAINSCN